MIINIILILVLIYESLCDVKNQRIRIIPLAAAGITGMLIGLLYEEKSWGQIFLSIVPGCVMLFTGWITRQSIGYGDGVVILAAGLCMGWRKAVCALWIALVLAGIVGSILVFLKKRGRNVRIALCPYILLGTVISLILGEL